MQRRHPLDGGRFFVVKRYDFTAHLDADQQADTTNLVDYVRVLFLNSGQSFQEETAHLGGILCKRVAVDDLEDFVRYGAGQRIAAEGRAVRPRAKHVDVHFGNPNGPHREAAAKRLCHAHGVRQIVTKLITENGLKTLERAGAKVPALYAVPKQQQVFLVAQFAEAKQVVGGGRPDAALTLHTFDHHRHRGWRDRGTHGVEVVEGDMRKTGEQGGKAVLHLRLAGR